MPVLDGRMLRYINLDNAASTPPLRSVVETVQRFLPYYSSVHRGAGFKSRVSTAAYDEAHDTIAGFVGADPSATRSSSARTRPRRSTSSPIDSRWRMTSVVISTEMEHHSNDLPWRARARVVRARVTADGRLDEDDVDGCSPPTAAGSRC